MHSAMMEWPGFAPRVGLAVPPVWPPLVLLLAALPGAVAGGLSNLWDFSKHHQHHVYRTGMHADVHLGAMFPIHDYAQYDMCGTKLRELGVVQYVEAVNFGVRLVNENPYLLPGVTLGTIVLDDCTKPETALGQALHFIPVQRYGHSRRDPNPQCEEFCTESETDDHRFHFYDVIGVIGSESSKTSIMVANVLGMFEIPQISPTATSDLLSNKDRFPYFLRMTPPDRYQVKAILNVIRHFKWTYIAAVYAKDGYGESAYELIRRLAPGQGVCIGSAVALAPGSTAKDYRDLVHTLHTRQARVVVLFTDQEESRGVLQATLDADLLGHFIWLGSDGVAINTDDLHGVEDVLHGAIMINAYSEEVAPFTAYYESLTPNDTENPWFKNMWAEMFHCSWDTPVVTASNAHARRHDQSDAHNSCHAYTSVLQSEHYSREGIVSTILDSVLAFAHALHELREAHCPGASGSDLRRCVRGDLYLSYIRNVTFRGSNGNISFDENGDALGRYEVLNFVRDEGKRPAYSVRRVGLYDIDSDSLTMDDASIEWNLRPSVWDKRAPGPNHTRPALSPPSDCGSKCKKGEVYSYFKGTCCWECRPCNINEITVDNATRCKPCKMYTWPDDENLTVCLPIEPTFVTWQHPTVIVFLSLSLLGILYCTVVFAIFLRNNNARLIKATSRELSYIMLGGETMQFILLLTVVARPSLFVCNFTYVGFNISFTVAYAPLLTRTGRIYRIFHAGKRTKTLPTCTSPFSQVVIALLLIAIQVLINVVVTVSRPPDVALRMPQVMVRYVEETCAFPMRGFVISLSYNVLLVVICSYYAFKTRQLPDNFNESRYISLCVYTTLVIWLAFLPSYFTATRSFYQMILTSCALIVNASVMLLCLYTPKIYALYHGTTDVTFKYNTTSKGSSASFPRISSAACMEDQRTELTDFGLNVNNSLNSHTSESGS